jgi:hypothetical protein
MNRFLVTVLKIIMLVVGISIVDESIFSYSIENYYVGGGD